MLKLLHIPLLCYTFVLHKSTVMKTIIQNLIFVTVSILFIGCYSEPETETVLVGYVDSCGQVQESTLRDQVEIDVDVRSICITFNRYIPVDINRVFINGYRTQAIFKDINIENRTICFSSPAWRHDVFTVELECRLY